VIDTPVVFGLVIASVILPSLEVLEKLSALVTNEVFGAIPFPFASPPPPPLPQAVKNMIRNGIISNLNLFINNPKICN
jgi:hypothetical protein